jgi:hypothetical protein
MQRRALLTVALVAGCCGLYLGVNCGYQVPVESAQVVAGIVSYSGDNPFYMYHVKTWTLVHQLAAGALRAGVDERQLSMVLGATVGAVSFLALAFCTLVVCRRVEIAVLSPIFCQAVAVHWEMEGVYPIRILSENPWLFYGVLATSLALLTWTFWGLGCYRVAAFLTGLGPCVHPTMGCWCALAVGAALVFQTSLRRAWRMWLGWLVLGGVVTAASFAVQQVIARGLPEISAEQRAAYVAAFASGWDTHRRPFPVTDVTFFYAGCAVAIGGALVRRGRPESGTDAGFFVNCVTVASILGTLLALSTHLEEHLPTMVMMAMPGRYINVVGLAFPAIALGVLARWRGKLLMEGLLCGIVAYACLRMLRFETKLYVPEIYYLILLASFVVLVIELGQPMQSHHRPTRLARIAQWLALLGIAIVGWRAASWRWPLPAVIWSAGVAVCVPPAIWARFERQWVLVVVRILTYGGAAILAWGVLGFLPAYGVGAALAAVHVPELITRYRLSRPAANVVTAGLSIAAMVALIVSAHTQVVIAHTAMHDYRSDPVLARAARGEGVLLSGSTVRSMQMFTRRPVLLEGAALNQLPYVPESGPAMNVILRAVYGDDLLEPRPSYWRRERGGLMHISAKQLWEQRSPKEWQELARRFNFTQIITHSNWGLQLPVLSFSRRYTLYGVPGVENARREQPSAEQTAGRDKATMRR